MTQCKRIIILLVIPLFISISLISCVKEPELERKLSEFITSYNEYSSYPYSGSILVARGDKILLNKGYSIADYEKSIPNTTSTIFPIGSITKSFTAVAIMQLCEKGVLDVDSPISNYIGVEIDDEPIKIHHLLTHTSGLPREGKFVGKDDITLKEQAEYITTLHVLFSPGEKFSYSNAGYMLLAYIIEEVSGDSYSEYVAKNIFKPLGMESSYVGMDASYGKDQAIGYRFLKDTPSRLHIYNFSNIIGSGNIYSTTEDLYTYARSFSHHTLISKESIESIFTPHWGEEHNRYGYGWELSERYNHQKVSHGGVIGGGGYASLIIRYPEEDYVLIFLTNNSELYALHAVSETLEAIIFNKEYVIPVEMKNYEIDSELLTTYVGDYVFKEGFTVSITHKDNHLYSTADDGNMHKLLPISDDVFFFEGYGVVKLQFERDEKHNDMKLTFYNRTSSYEGVKR